MNPLLALRPAASISGMTRAVPYAGDIAEGDFVICLDHLPVGHVVGASPDRLRVQTSEGEIVIDRDAVFCVTSGRVELICDGLGLVRYLLTT